jgi:hypothetical protein
VDEASTFPITSAWIGTSRVVAFAMRTETAASPRAPLAPPLVWDGPAEAEASAVPVFEHPPFNNAKQHRTNRIGYFRLEKEPKEEHSTMSRTPQ